MSPCPLCGGSGKQGDLDAIECPKFSPARRYDAFCPQIKQNIINCSAAEAAGRSSRQTSSLVNSVSGRPCLGLVGHLPPFSGAVPWFLILVVTFFSLSSSHHVSASFSSPLSHPLQSPTRTASFSRHTPGRYAARLVDILPVHRRHSLSTCSESLHAHSNAVWAHHFSSPSF